MLRLTDHFTKEEFEYSPTAIEHGIDNTCPSHLVSNLLKVAIALEMIRVHFGSPVIISSGYRCPELNDLIGGSKTSAHRHALAADFIVVGVSNKVIFDWYIDNVTGYDQIIYEFGEDGWIHLGFSETRDRHEKLVASKKNGKTVYSVVA